MQAMPTVLEELFGPGLAPAEYGSRLEAFKSALGDSISEARRGDTQIARDKTIVKRAGVNARLESVSNIEKSLTGEQSAALSQDIAAMRTDIQKDWTPTNPVSTGLVPYDLEGPAKVLVPLYTPLRNSIPRVKGQGNARKFKRIDSFSNAGIPGGSGVLTPFFNSTTTTSTWGPTGNITLARPAKISYTGSDWSIPYVEMGLSDSVDWVNYFEGLGFDDQKALSHTALLYADMMGEERAMLYARGSASGYEGAVTAPTAAVVGSDSGGSLATATYFVYVAAVTGFGQTAVSSVQSSGARTGPSASVAITVTEPAGSLGIYNLYVGTTTGIANAHYQGTFTGSTYTLTSYSSAVAPIAGTDSSADANSYDGFLTVLSDSTKSGYLTRLNAALSTTNPGVEFDTALSTMYTNNGADPDEIWMTGSVRAELAQSMRKAAGSGYRTTLVSGDGGVTMGTVVTGIANPNTGKVVDLKTHRFMPAGCALIRSTSLPIQDAHVPAPAQVVAVQDYMAVDWPTIQMTYDTSTYKICTLVHYAPAWSGLITNIL
jgi:hypothetical protein